ncbi:uncharacterized protein LOC101849699 [Aplysia californica]|uniref:Uncharacterized protein LOC101849699 n=1 Tax=Aplysia californica TaxID=6500 RepID=A0ABM0JR43_APLCA|nr:uncharacterized protein LOC101849699 [Aplysia californica]
MLSPWLQLGAVNKLKKGFNPTFKIQGKPYRRLGNLLPTAGTEPKFARTFFPDSATELQDRLRLSHILRSDILNELQPEREGETADFSNNLLNIGDGKHNVCKQIGEFAIKLPDDITLKSERVLINFVFGNLQSNTNPDWLAFRCIICPTNTEVDRINNPIMQSFSGEEKVCRSSDSMDENEHQYQIEFINSLCPSGMPPHKLTLRKDSMVMLLRNLDPANGHCNGTRYVVQNLQQHVIDAVVACGPYAGKRLFIPRIPLMPSDNIIIFPFHMRRTQFRLDMLSFCNDYHLSSGQTLKRIGVSLQGDFFPWTIIFRNESCLVQGIY